VKALSTEKARHLILRAEAGEVLPDGLARELRDQAVTCGWYRASGVLEDVALRAYNADVAGPGGVRKVAGPVHVIALEGSVGLAAGDVSFGMRAILARETDRGMETLAGELVSARVIALEVMVSAFDDLAVGRAIDPKARIWILGETAGSAIAAAPAPPPPKACRTHGTRQCHAGAHRAARAPRRRQHAVSGSGRHGRALRVRPLRGLEERR
jgi:predicted DNA-binding protein with PD1-like motif